MIFSEGKSTSVEGLKAVVATKELRANKEYVFDYQTPPVAYRVLSPSAISALLKGWLRLKGDIVEITGVTINTDNGRVRVRAIVQPQPEVQQAAVVNPWVILAALAAIFSAIGITVSLIYVYEVTTGGTVAPGQPDPCSTSGIQNYIRCLARKSGWVAFGISLGALLMLVFILMLVGRKA